MSLQYAKDQPAGFNNRIDKIAIVGVRSLLSTLCKTSQSVN